MKIVEINAIDNSVIERDATTEEIAQKEIDDASYQAIKAQEEAEAQAKSSAKAALLERLGMTAEEAALLLS